MTGNQKIQVAIVGAGPAGLFAAEKLAQEGYQVAIFNRDIKPGGMAEYGIFLDKHSMKAGLRRQFDHILSLENITYFGNVMIGKGNCVSLDDLLHWGFPAVLITAGAQGTKNLGIPGELSTGVYHSKDVVYHYNKLPPFSTMKIDIGKRVAIVGAGKVMTDVAHYLINYCDVEEILVIVRRGPAEVKFERKELEPIVSSFDLKDLDREFERVSPVMRSIGQDPFAEKELILSALAKAYPNVGNADLKMRFLLSPKEILTDENGRAKGLIVEENTLVLDNGYVAAKGLNKLKTFDVDTVIFAIGDRVDEALGLPIIRNEYAKSSEPLYPVEGQSYEIEDPLTGQWINGLFVAGWSRNASTGLVGIAKKDGINAAISISGYLKTLDDGGIDNSKLNGYITKLSCPVVRKENLDRLVSVEIEKALELGLDEFKFSTNEEMLQVMGL